MCDLLGGVRFCFSCVDPQKWNYSIIGNCECNSVGDGSVFLSSHNHSVPSSSAQDFLFSLLSPALGAVSACKIRSGSSLWGTPTSQRTADPSPATHGMRVSVFWLEPPVPSGSPFFPPLSPKLYKPPPPPSLVSSFRLQVRLQPLSYVANLGRGQPCVPTACEPERLLPPEQVTYSYGLILL